MHQGVRVVLGVLAGGVLKGPDDGDGLRQSPITAEERDSFIDAIGERGKESCSSKEPTSMQVVSCMCTSSNLALSPLDLTIRNRKVRGPKLPRSCWAA